MQLADISDDPKSIDNYQSGQIEMRQ